MCSSSIIFWLLLIFTLVAARIILTAAIKCLCFCLLSESMWTLKLSRKKESASLLFFLFLGVRRFTFRNGRVLSIVLQYVTPNVSVSSFFGGFSTDIWSLPRFLNNFFLLFANIWFWLYCLLLFTYLLILGLLLQFSFWGILLFAVIGLLLLCISFFIRCFFLETFWVSPFCTISVIIDRSALMPLIWFSSVVFLLVLSVYCFFSLGFLAFYHLFRYYVRTHIL